MEKLENFSENSQFLKKEARQSNSLELDFGPLKQKIISNIDRFLDLADNTNTDLDMDHLESLLQFGEVLQIVSGGADPILERLMEVEFRIHTLDETLKGDKRYATKEDIDRIRTNNIPDYDLFLKCRKMQHDILMKRLQERRAQKSDRDKISSLKKQIVDMSTAPIAETKLDHKKSLLKRLFGK